MQIWCKLNSLTKIETTANICVSIGYRRFWLKKDYHLGGVWSPVRVWSSRHERKERHRCRSFFSCKHSCSSVIKSWDNSHVIPCFSLCGLFGGVGVPRFFSDGEAGVFKNLLIADATRRVPTCELLYYRPLFMVGGAAFLPHKQIVRQECRTSYNYVSLHIIHIFLLF